MTNRGLDGGEAASIDETKIVTSLDYGDEDTDAYTIDDNLHGVSLRPIEGNVQEINNRIPARCRLGQ